MKKKFLIILLFFIVPVTFGQNKIITRKFTTTQVEKIDFSKTYNKDTGKKMKKKDYIKLVENNQNIELEKIIGTAKNFTKEMLKNKIE